MPAACWWRGSRPGRPSSASAWRLARDARGSRDELFVEALLLATARGVCGADHRPRRCADARQCHPAWLRSRGVRRALRLAARPLHRGNVNRGSADCRRTFHCGTCCGANPSAVLSAGSRSIVAGRGGQPTHSSPRRLAVRSCSSWRPPPSGGCPQPQSRQSRLRPIGCDRLHGRCECGVDQSSQSPAYFSRLYDTLAGLPEVGQSPWFTSAC